ncbi:YgiT-type zinc finger protein [Bathymodiolus japonicus methanotrophic gill symbiont]|uniref:YgiT-type zinc finger protein n=1 Tax=Bathymodiolus japonicus methanotrophic gill symbiont TaxID=113269 RepID=UPI003083F88E
MESESEAMKLSEKYPICGGELESKQVEKLLRGGGNTVSMRVSAEVCLHCGERLYPENVVKVFEQIRNKLCKQEFSHFKNLVKSCTVDGDWLNEAIQPVAQTTNYHPRG